MLRGRIIEQRIFKCSIPKSVFGLQDPRFDSTYFLIICIPLQHEGTSYKSFQLLVVTLGDACIPRLVTFRQMEHN